MRIVNDFLPAPDYPTTLPGGLSASGRFYDMKTHIIFSTDISLPAPAPSYRVTKFSVDIDKANKSSASNVGSGSNNNDHQTNDRVPYLQSSETTNSLRLQPTTISTNSATSSDNIMHPFVDGNAYRIIYEIYISHTAQGVTTKYKLVHTQYFTYYTTPITLSDFSLDPNVQVGDSIDVTGLLLVEGSAPDSTLPEEYTPDDLTLPEYTPDYEAVQFTFQEAEASTGSTNNDQPTEPYIVDLSYNPLGNYTLPYNTLTNGKIYYVDVEANWRYGYSAYQRSSQPLYILNRPSILSVNKKNLSVHDSDDVVIDITMDELIPSGAVALPDTISFEFINSNNVLVAKTGNVTVTPTSGDLYSFKLSDIDIVSNGGILIDNQYGVKAVVQYPNGSSPPHERRSDAVSVTFDLVRPVISSVTAYDVQNDGGEDGVFHPHPNATDVDSASQIVATIDLADAAYELYAPNVTNGILFIFYDANEVEKARTSSYNFSNDGTNLYNIQLDEINASTLLRNGTPYKVKAQVTLVDHSGDTVNPELRLSANFFDVTFSQNVAPVPSVYIENTWALATDNNPSSSPTRFNASPIIGVSGYFMKTAQFGPAYSKQLDITSTKFKIEYQVDNGSWVDATKAVLDQKLVSETMAEAASRVATSSVVSRSDGLYANVVGSGIGTDQEEMVFYIPQDQGSGNPIAFTEDNNVKVRVTVVAAPGLWVTGESSSIPRVSNLLDLVDKISPYDPTGSAEPWNHEPNNDLLYVERNGEIVTDIKSSVRADSSNIITYTREGWRVINTGGGTKVSLYYYRNVAAADQTPSNSFTVNSINGLGIHYVFDHHQGAREYPFVGLYTTPTASGNKASWYKSRIVYNNNNNSKSALGDTTLDSSRAGITLLYTGTDVPSFRPDIPSARRVKLDINLAATNTFGNYGNEVVNLIAINTDSSSTFVGKFNFTLSEANLTTSSSVLSSLSVKFTKNLFLNIPVELESSSDSVKVGYKYNASHSYRYRTFNYPNSEVSLYVDPNQGTTIYYSIAYITNSIEGLVFETNVPNKYFPVSTDYTVANSAYKTFNTHSESSVLFDLTLAADSKNRLDGVNVYFTSPDTSTGSDITKVRVGSYTTTGSKTIPLMQVSGGVLRIMDTYGNIVDSVSSWGDHDLANISFEAFRDARVTSSNALYTSPSSASAPDSSSFYVESGSQSTFGTSSDSNPIWNVPDLTPPSEDASDENIYELSGGVINIEAGPSFHVITWPTSNDANGSPFMYDLKITKNDVTTPPLRSEQNLGGNSYVLPIDLDNVAKYTIEITKVFNGLIAQRELSETDTIVFHTVKVDTSNMDVSVQNPSTTSSVTLSWNAPDISGNSVTASGFEASSFSNNIYAHHIQYRTGSSGAFSKLDNSVVLIENTSPKLYTLPNVTLGTLYEFVMYVKAHIRYTLNGAVSSTKSTPYTVPLTPVNTESKYIVSTVPSVDEIPNSVATNIVPVLVQGSSNPTLLLNLNANGLETEGFISVVVILTQDGTAQKPDGEQALLIFPDPNPTHPLHPFSSNTFANTVTGTSGAGTGDVRLAGGDSAVSVPKNVTPSVLSTDPNDNEYTLTIGTTGSGGRYGLSTLQMPSSANSGFVGGSPVNYMVILTTRRGTDIGVGEFTYEALPSVQNVQIVTENGQYYVQFVINSA